MKRDLEMDQQNNIERNDQCAIEDLIVNEDQAAAVKGGDGPSSSLVITFRGDRLDPR